MEYSLQKGKIISLSKDKYSLKVSEGVVWLTCPDDSRDYFLKKGERFKTRTGGKFILEALADSMITIDCEETRVMSRWTIQVNLELSRNFSAGGQITHRC